MDCTNIRQETTSSQIYANMYIYIYIIQYICFLHTCVPNILHPNISASSKEQPVHRDEEKANHV